MNTAKKAMITRELQRASAALSAAAQMVANDSQDKVQIKLFRDQQRALGNLITGFNGGPTMTLPEMMTS